MRLNLKMDQVLERNAREVSQQFRSKGIDPDRPYRAQVTLQQIIIEQDSRQEEHPASRI